MSENWLPKNVCRKIAWSHCRNFACTLKNSNLSELCLRLLSIVPGRGVTSLRSTMRTSRWSKTIKLLFATETFPQKLSLSRPACPASCPVARVTGLAWPMLPTREPLCGKEPTLRPATCIGSRESPTMMLIAGRTVSNWQVIKNEAKKCIKFLQWQQVWRSGARWHWLPRSLWGRQHQLGTPHVLWKVKTLLLVWIFFSWIVFLT